ncbi:MAG: hypothetical protein CBB70_05480 [Planctomycetaceae bacterium TMED10]|nr:MAG: hypothetical protein CBB70_05480 [Planctomycetaceae bacterium TMED10]|tara:strand:- start:1753 stop:2127 length:375 start_codon:yes stop_codon:yes gene_type:complete
MTAPNIVNVATINGKTALTALSSATAGSVLANGASSNKVLKLAGVLATNTSGSSSVTASFDLYITRGGVDYYLAKEVPIPALSVYEAFLKDGTPVYLEEGDTLYAKSDNASGYLHVMVAYEDIS